MAGKRKNFLNYSAARTLVIALGLTSMQDWIAYAKSGNRPADIPSNPWNVYKDELAAMTPPQKFNINEFIGCKLPRKARVAKDGAVKAPKTPKVAKAPKAVKEPKTATAPVADEPVDAPDTSGLSPFEIAKTAIQEMKLTNREAFYDLKRKNLLPVGVPRNPDTTFKTEWKGWGDFLGNVASATTAADAEATF